MFNLKNHTTNCDSEVQLLRSELNFFDIVQSHPSGYDVLIGDESVHTETVSEIIPILKEGILELKEHIWEAWNDLGQLAESVINDTTGNEGGVDNIFFLNSVKRAFLLSQDFSELQEITEKIKNLFNIDVSEVHPDLIEKFNRTYLTVKLVHKLIMTELYKTKLVQQYMQQTKTAGISGPWSNLDLPMAERMWSYGEDEEYFAQRTKARKEQTRYNPENDKNGFFFVWQDLTRGPYNFGDIKKDSPYKSRHLLSIP